MPGSVWVLWSFSSCLKNDRSVKLTEYVWHITSTHGMNHPRDRLATSATVKSTGKEEGGALPDSKENISHGQKCRRQGLERRAENLGVETRQQPLGIGALWGRSYSRSPCRREAEARSTKRLHRRWILWTGSHPSHI